MEKKRTYYFESSKRNNYPLNTKKLHELIEEHIIGRKTTSQLETAKTLYFLGQKEALALILEKIDFLVKFYPKHIEKEDKRFFQPVMKYFSLEEQNKMLKEGHIFDRKMIHKIYSRLVSELEEKIGLTSVMSKNWLEYL